jgi:hypothetical protein
MTDITQILAQIAQAADPTEVIKANVLQEGGLWLKPGEQVRSLVEIQLCGLVGIGPSVATAVDDWIVQARHAAQKAELAAAE